MVPCPTSSLTRRYLTHLVEASAHCICRAGCGKAAVEPCQLALHLPLSIHYNAPLCSASTYSVDFKDRAMQDREYEFPRISIPRTPVNKGAPSIPKRVCQRPSSTVPAPVHRHRLPVAQPERRVPGPDN